MLTPYGDDVWLTSDTHLGHQKIIGYCNRPFKYVNDMDSYIITHWNDVIGHNDTVLHLGDVSFYSNRYLPYLNGNIHLIKGNHDSKTYNSLFHGVSDFLYLKIGEFTCFLRHRPVFPDDKRNTPEVTAQEASILNSVDFVIHGHVHNNFLRAGKNINVGVDMWNFRPIHISKLIGIMKGVQDE